MRVAHDEGGDWQFLPGGEAPNLENGAIVCLEDMILSNPTLHECFDLEYGEIAERKSVLLPWIRSKE